MLAEAIKEVADRAATVCRPTRTVICGGLAVIGSACSSTCSGVKQRTEFNGNE